MTSTGALTSASSISYTSQPIAFLQSRISSCTSHRSLQFVLEELQNPQRARPRSFTHNAFSDELEGLREAIYYLDRHPDRSKLLFSQGYNTTGEFVHTLIETSLWNRIETKVEVDFTWLIKLTTEELSSHEPNSIPDVMGSLNAPGEFVQKMQDYLCKLEKRALNSQERFYLVQNEIQEIRENLVNLLVRLEDYRQFLAEVNAETLSNSDFRAHFLQRIKNYLAEWTLSFQYFFNHISTLHQEHKLEGFDVFFSTLSKLQFEIPDVEGQFFAYAYTSSSVLLKELQGLFAKLEEQYGKVERTFFEQNRLREIEEAKKLQEEFNSFDFCNAAWQALEACIRDARVLPLFSRDLAQRKKEYQRFAYLLSRAFDSLKSRGLEELFFVSNGGIYDLPSTCYTGWHHRIETMFEGDKSSESLNYFQVAHICARNLRRAIVDLNINKEALKCLGYHPGVMADVHSRQVVRQWANQYFYLGYAPEELGATDGFSKDLQQPLTQVAANVIKREYTGLALVQALQEGFENLEEIKKEQMIDAMLDLYKEACQEDAQLLINPLLYVQSLYTKVKEANDIQDAKLRSEVLSKLKKEFLAQELEVPFSTKTFYQELELELKDRYPNIFHGVFHSLDLDRYEDDDRAQFFFTRYEKIPLEERVDDLKRLIEQMLEASKPSQRDFYLEKQRKRVFERIEAFDDYRLRVNVSLLRKKICKRGKLEIFGAMLWLCMARLIIPASENGDRSALKILQWARTAPFPLPDSFMKILKVQPNIYTQLPKSMQNLEPIYSYVQANPWLVSGAQSEEEYNYYYSQKEIDLSKAPAWVRKEKALVLRAVQQNGLSLYFANKELCKDLDLACAAVAQNPYAMQWVDKQLRGNDKLVQITLKTWGARELAHYPANPLPID